VPEITFGAKEKMRTKTLLLLTAYCLLLTAYCLLFGTSSPAFGEWTRTVLDTTNDLRAIDGYVGTSVVTLCAAGEKGTVFLSTNYGTTWTNISKSPIPSDLTIKGVAVTQSCLYIAGTSNSLGGKIYKSTNWGTSWIDITPSDTTYSSVSDISFLDDNYGIFCAGTSAGSEIRYTTDGGTNWSSPNTAPTTNTYNYQSVFYCSTSSLWVAGSSGVIWKSTNAGKDWTKVNEDVSGVPTIQGLYFVDANHGFAVDDNKNFYYTTDGNTWITNNLSLTDNYGVYATDSNNVYIAGSSNKILKMTYSGGSWIESTSYTSSVTGDLHYDIWGVDENNIWAVGHGGSGIVVSQVASSSAASITNTNGVSQFAQNTNQKLFINGTNFPPGSYQLQIIRDGNPVSGITTSNVNRLSSTQIEANISVGSGVASGPVDAKLTTPTGQIITITNAFSVTPPPTVTQVKPDSCKEFWIGNIVVSGNNFNHPVVTCSDSNVRIISQTATASEIQIQVDINGASPGNKIFYITNQDLGSTQFNFTVLPRTSPPTISKILIDDRVYLPAKKPMFISSSPKVELRVEDSAVGFDDTCYPVFYGKTESGSIHYYFGRPADVILSNFDSGIGAYKNATATLQIPTNDPLGEGTKYLYCWFINKNGDPVLDYAEVTIGGTGTTTNITNIFAGPNPITSKHNSVTLQFTSQNDFTGSIVIMNTLGQKIYEISPLTIKAGINKVLWNLNSYLGSIPNGLYLFLVTGDGKTLAKGKVMVAR